MLNVSHAAIDDLNALHASVGVETLNVRCTRVASIFLDPILDSRHHDLQPVLSRWIGDDSAPVEILRRPARPPAVARSIHRATRIERLLTLQETMMVELENRGLCELYLASCSYLSTALAIEAAGLPDPMVERCR